MNYKIKTAVGAIVLALAGLPTAFAGVSTQEAEQLKSTLTPLGGEKAGNKDGSIPAWTGAAIKSGKDLFAGEKPLYSVNSTNMGSYADKLSDGVKALLNKYPNSFRLDVYPTHRTAAAPQWVYENTAKNAVSAKIGNDGLTLEGAYGGVPFPIPKSGQEVHWNHLLQWRGESVEYRMKVWAITASGEAVLATGGITYEQFPYYRKDGKGKYGGVFLQALQATESPPFRAGEAILMHEQADYTKDRLIWQYLAGQRRVRRAPNIGFDTPDFAASGVRFFDEPFGWMGSPERFDFKLVGKKEMLVPYNNNKLLSTKDVEAIGAHHLKPEHVRWELHRVWVVEATLKKDKRHAVPKRVVYYDEDSWGTLIMDGWDAQGKLWHTSLSLPFVVGDLPAVTSGCTDAFFNIQTGAWVYSCAMGDTPADQQYRAVTPRNDTFFSSDALSGFSAR